MQPYFFEAPLLGALLIVICALILIVGLWLSEHRARRSPDEQGGE